MIRNLLHVHWQRPAGRIGAHLVLAVLVAAVLTLAALDAARTGDRGLQRDRVCLDTLHGHPTPLGCRLPDGTVLHPTQIPPGTSGDRPGLVPWQHLRGARHTPRERHRALHIPAHVDMIH